MSVFFGWDRVSLSKGSRKNERGKVMLFEVVYKVEGRLTYVIRANSEEEAKEMAESRLQDSELGDLEYIDSEIVTLNTVTDC